MIRKKIASDFNEFLSDSERYISPLGEISLIFPCMANFNTYEIYCISGDLFEDVERYKTFDEAEERIYELLEP